MKVGCVGVGAMGREIARHIVEAGHEVWASDVDKEAMESAASVGAVPVQSLADLAPLAEVFIVVVATDAQSKEVTEALLKARIREGAIIAIVATNHPDTMIELAGKCRAKSVGFVDAPVCYGLQGAKNGNLITLCGGDKADIETIRPVLSTYSRSIEIMGGHGAGQLAKTCNNMLHWAACVANYEVLLLAKRYGLGAQQMRETLLKCPGKNITLERWDTSKFTWHEKDMDVALELSQAAGLSLPHFGQVDQLVKTLGPDKVKELLYGEAADYLGQVVTPLNRDDPNP